MRGSSQPKNNSQILEHDYYASISVGVDPYFPVLGLVKWLRVFEGVLCVSDDQDFPTTNEFLDRVI